MEGDAWTAPGGDYDKVNTGSMSQIPYWSWCQHPDLCCHQQFRMQSRSKEMQNALAFGNKFVFEILLCLGRVEVGHLGGGGNL